MHQKGTLRLDAMHQKGKLHLDASHQKGTLHLVPLYNINLLKSVRLTVLYCTLSFTC